MTSIRNNNRFKKDCDRYIEAIKVCNDNKKKLELKSLYDQFLKLADSLDQSFNNLITDRIQNTVLLDDTKNKLQTIRSQIENLIK